MKKFLRIVSLTLMLAMLLPMTPVELFAEEAQSEEEITTLSEDSTDEGVDDSFESDNDTDYPEGWDPDESVFGEFATSTHDTSLTQLKQDIYSTGLNAYKVNEGDIDATDGVIDAEYVKVTPNAVDHGPSHTYMQKTSNTPYHSLHQSVHWIKQHHEESRERQEAEAQPRFLNSVIPRGQELSGAEGSQ